jgi:hypothetical protein
MVQGISHFGSHPPLTNRAVPPYYENHKNNHLSEPSPPTDWCLEKYLYRFDKMLSSAYILRQNNAIIYKLLFFSIFIPDNSSQAGHLRL